jgi:hypothetical protein
MAFDPSQVKEQILSGLNTNHAADPSARDAASRLAKEVSCMIDTKLETFRREISVREKVVDLEKTACVTVVADYQKRIAELEAQLKEKNNGI